MNTPSFVSGLCASQMLEATASPPNRRRHTWRWRWVFMLLGLCLGWAMRGLLI